MILSAAAAAAVGGIGTGDGDTEKVSFEVESGSIRELSMDPSPESPAGTQVEKTIEMDISRMSKGLGPKP